jgi:hypothetical protein
MHRKFARVCVCVCVCVCVFMRVCASACAVRRTSCCVRSHADLSLMLCLQSFEDQL